MASDHCNFLSTIFVLFVIFFTISFSNQHVSEATNDGFTIDLIHRDSPLSPLYNPSAIPSSHLDSPLSPLYDPSAISWHRWRQNNFHLPKNRSNADAGIVVPNNGDYLVKFSIGTPTVQVFGIIDVGSSLIWTQCEPCPGCYKQINPLFKPGSSSTYKNLPCQDHMCKELDPAGPCKRSKDCEYGYGYADGSYTKGNLATDTFTFGEIKVEKKVFGCGHNDSGVFQESDTGIVGLGRGSMSLVSQLTPSFGPMFSYCFVPFSASSGNSKLSIGSTKGAVSGEGTVSTPLVLKPTDSFYRVTLEAMSVGNTRLPYDYALSPDGNKEGNIIIDTGTPPIVIPTEFRNQIVEAVKGAIRAQPLPNRGTQLCYPSGTQIDLTITAHFTGADIQLKPVNTFVKVLDGAICFAMDPSDGIAIFGNFAQINFLVGYDLENKRVFFKQTDCTRAQ